ncbi:MAG: type II toxin-antitoxin system VapC family toxin [Candidatus Baltobacteraceae bacterium]
MDASVAVAWYLPDESERYASMLLERIEDSQIVVPAIWPAETANALLSAERRGRSSREATDCFIDSLRSLPIEVASESDLASLPSLLALARENGLTAYDASYLRTALGFGLSLATLDERLRSAARRSGIELTA